MYYKIFYSGDPIMPAWGKSGGFTEEEVRKVGNFLLAQRADPPSLEAANKADGKVRWGRAIFSTNCSGCHGLNGRAELVEPKLSAWAPELNNEGFLAAATDGFLQATIVVGRTGTAMRPFGTGFNGLVDLTMDEIDDLVAYIRRWSSLAPAPTTLPAERSINAGGD